MPILFSVHLRTLGGWMEYMDPETLNRFYYQNELVLRVSPEDAKTKARFWRLGWISVHVYMTPPPDAVFPRLVWLC